jgi:aspartate/methionine/tyrosine aminotransferase
VERNRAVIVSNLDLLDAFFDAHTDRFEWQRPKAGPIAFPRLLGDPVEDFCQGVLRNAGVLLLPGTLYREGLDEFRIGFGRKDFPEGLTRLDRYLRSRA